MKKHYRLLILLLFPLLISSVIALADDSCEKLAGS